MVLAVEHPAGRKGRPRGRPLEPLRRVDGQYLPGALGGLQRGVAAHECDAARIAAEVDRSEIRVGGDDRYVERIDAQDFGDDVGQDRVRTLADLRGPAEDRDAAAAIASQLHARVRHVVPVNREPGARDVARAREPHAPSVWQLPELSLPAGSLDDLLDALPQAHRADAQV